MALPYFKHCPQDFLHDPRIIKLTFEEKGVYWQLINEMWSAKMQLPDDEEFLSTLLRIPLDRWLAIKKKLSIGRSPLIESRDGLLLNMELRHKFTTAEEYVLMQSLKRAKNKEGKQRKIARLPIK